MKLNPTKCAFGVCQGNFLGFMVNHRGIEANPAKIQALLDMEPPQKIKKMQSLTGCVATLNRFISCVTDKCQPFFKALRRGKYFSWSVECEQSFKELKEYLGRPPLLSKPRDGESLILYVAVFEGAVNMALLWEEDRAQQPIYYTSKFLLDVETRYPDMEKLALALIVAARKLRPYFQAHSVVVSTKFPLKQVLQKPEASSRLAKWAIELGEFDIQFNPRIAIKGQALTDFVAKFTYISDNVLPSNRPPPDLATQWNLFVDRLSTESSSRAGVILISLKGVKLSCALRSSFPLQSHQQSSKI